MRTITIVRALDSEGLLTERVLADDVPLTRPFYVQLDPGYSRFCTEYARAAYHLLRGPHRLVVHDAVNCRVTILEERAQ